MYYEKLYKKALERAREWYNDPHITIGLKGNLEDIFPEFKESDDEKIIKSLLFLCDEWEFKPEHRTVPAEEYVKEIRMWLEKQNKQILANSAKTCKDEQKPADKVEPKFKVGDWIVNNNIGYVYQVTEIRDDEYCLWSLDTEKEGYFIIIDVDNDYHLWSIQDAKDGDVLAVEEIEEKYQYPFVAIYKERGLDFFNSYCSIGFDGKFYEGNTGHSTKKIHPATKEQRNLLFQKMKEAGYEWDAEKKELRKIELAKSESEEELSDFEAALFSAFSDGWQQYLHGEEVDFAQWAREHSAELLEAANQNHVAWSEEDEKMVIALMSICDEWATRHSYLPKENNDIEKIKRWLKSLRPQKQWKPSDEQMNALKEACDKHWEPDGLDPLYTLYEQLKKLIE